MWTVVRVSDGVWQKRRNLSAEHHCSVYWYASRNGLGHVSAVSAPGRELQKSFGIAVAQVWPSRRLPAVDSIRPCGNCSSAAHSSCCSASWPRALWRPPCGIGVSPVRILAQYLPWSHHDPPRRECSSRRSGVLPVSARRSAAHAAILRHIFLAERAFLNNGNNICRKQQNRDFAYFFKICPRRLAI